MRTNSELLGRLLFRIEQKRYVRAGMTGKIELFEKLTVDTIQKQRDRGIAGHSRYQAWGP